MGVDTPDWGGQYNSADFYPLSDMAELAVRLGSIHTYDRRGNVVWYTDFSRGLGVVGQDHQGATSVVSLSAALPDYSGFTALMNTDNNNGDFMTLDKKIQLPSSPRIGFSSLFSSVTGLHDIVLRAVIYLNGTYYEPRVKFLQSASQLQVMNASAAYVTIPLNFGFSLSLGQTCFLKMVADVSTGYYERLIFGNQQIDLTSYAMRGGSTGTKNQILASLDCLGDASQEKQTHIFSWTITANEPDN